MKKLLNEELNRLTVEEFKASAKIPVVVVLDNIRSLNNIGSAFRTSDAFRVKAMYLCGITAKPPHRDINKTALGATESVEWHYFEHTLEAVNQLKSEGYTIASVEQTENAVMLNDFSPDENASYALVFGNEVKGVEQNIVDNSHFALEIPQFGTKHSLNISVSVGVVLWHFVCKSGWIKTLH